MKVHPELRRFTAYVRTLFCHYHPISDGTESQDQQFLRLRYGNQYCWRTQDTFCPPCNVPYNSTAVLKRLQHSPITKGRFGYRTTATRDRQKIIGKVYRHDYASASKGVSVTEAGPVEKALRHWSHRALLLHWLAAVLFYFSRNTMGVLPATCRKTALKSLRVAKPSCLEISRTLRECFSAKLLHVRFLQTLHSLLRSDPFLFSHATYSPFAVMYSRLHPVKNAIIIEAIQFV